MNGIFWKLGLLATITGLGLAFEAWLTTAERPQVMEAALVQLDGDGNDTIRIEHMHQMRSLRRLAIAVVVALAALELIFIDIGSRVTAAASKWVNLKPTCSAKATAILCLLALLPLTTGCWRPFEPVELQTISPNEEA